VLIGVETAIEPVNRRDGTREMHVEPPHLPEAAAE
jgi:hypothetical protein